MIDSALRPFRASPRVARRSSEESLARGVPCDGVALLSISHGRPTDGTNLSHDPRAVAAMVAVCLIPVLAHAQGGPKYLTLPVELRVASAPVVAFGPDGHAYLSYLLLVNNWAAVGLRLERLEVRGNSPKPLLVWDSTALANPGRLRGLGSLPVADHWPDMRTLRPNAGVGIWIYIELPDSALVPRTLRHRLEFQPTDSLTLLASDTAGAFSVEGATTPVGQAAVAITPPLTGGPWRCSNGLGPYNAHTQPVTYAGGRPGVSQRFACDFQKVDSAGNVLPNPFPDAIGNSMFYGYGANVLAVGDGVIAQFHDGVPENVPQASGQIRMAVPLTSATIAGNWIALELRPGVFALYAHLQPGSIRVRLGEHVRRGQILARLSDSGNAVGPHLHFQLASAPEFNVGHGLPFSFSTPAVTIIGKNAHPRDHAFTPLDGTLLTFPATRGAH